MAVSSRVSGTRAKWRGLQDAWEESVRGRGGDERDLLKLHDKTVGLLVPHYPFEPDHM